MEILKGIEIIGLALFIKKHKTLIIADIHIGYEEALNKQGILVPRYQFKKVIAELKSKKKINILAIMPDRGDRYKDTIYNDEWYLNLLNKKNN